MDYGILIILIFIVAFIILIIRNLSDKTILSCKPVNIAWDKIEKYLNKVQNELKLLTSFGFEQFDYFDYSTKNVPFYVYFMKLTGKPIYCGIYFSGKGDFINNVIFYSTNFENGYMLTTTPNRTSGSIPDIPGYFLQIFENKSLEELLKLHSEAVDFIEKKTNTKSIEFESVNFRESFHSKQQMIKNQFGGYIYLKMLLFKIKGRWKDFDKPVWSDK